MATQYVTSIFPDSVSLFTVTTNPNGALTAPSGSVALRTDNGNVSIYLNDNDATAWVRVLDATAAGDLDLTDVSQILLLDNANPAISIGSTGTLDLLSFITTTGVERVVYNGTNPFTIATGGLTVQAGTVSFPGNTVNVATAATAALAGTVAAALTLQVAHPGGAAQVNTVLPARAGGWRVLDAMVVASAAGGAAASVQVQTAAAAAVSSTLVIDGAVVAGSVVRTTSLLNTVFASGATLRVQGVNAPAASNVFITLAPL
jgi:hypothetical protein